MVVGRWGSDSHGSVGKCGFWRNWTHEESKALHKSKEKVSGNGLLLNYYGLLPNKPTYQMEKRWTSGWAQDRQNTGVGPRETPGSQGCRLFGESWFHQASNPENGIIPWG